MRQPAEVFPPGDFLAEELAVRGWTAARLATEAGVPDDLIARVLSGVAAITPALADRIGAALGTSAGWWTNLEAAYRATRAEGDG